MWFFERNKNHQDQIINDWIRYTEHENDFKLAGQFLIPFIIAGQFLLPFINPCSSKYAIEATFWNFWKQEFTKLHLGVSNEDVCTICHIFRNQLNSNSKKKMTRKTKQLMALAQTSGNDNSVPGSDIIAQSVVIIVDINEAPGMILQETEQDFTFQFD